MSNFYIADLHLGHANVIRFDNRPFGDVSEMDEKLINNWNGVVTNNNDTVYILGDLLWLKESEWPAWISRLKGRKVLIRGNHDPKDFSAATKKLFQEITDYKEITDGDRKVILCHYPIPFHKSDYSDRTWMLYGHVHVTWEYEYLKKIREEIKQNAGEAGRPVGNFINVGCMMPYMDYTPKTLDDIIASDERYSKSED